MKIVYNDVNKVSFEDLQLGDVFRYNTILFMKIETSTRKNAVRLDDGRCTDFIDEYVEPVKGKFVMD
jgi:hypothetical protein